MTAHEDEYRDLREQSPDVVAGWLQTHAPAGQRGHWWLALIEHAEFDANPHRGLPREKARENLLFAVELVEMAQADGMPAYYAASRLARLASAMLKTGQPLEVMPEPIIPDVLARRIVAAFCLDKRKALAVASRLRASSTGYGSDDAESDALRDINWLLPDLEMLAPHISDENLTLTIRQWLDVSADLSPV
jgi:hypothetical protein